MQQRRKIVDTKEKTGSGNGRIGRAWSLHANSCEKEEEMLSGKGKIGGQVLSCYMRIIAKSRGRNEGE